MADPLSFRLKKQFDRYIHDPIAAALSIPLFLILKILPYKISSYLCGTLMYLIAPLTFYNHRVKKHMQIAFPKKSKKEIKTLQRNDTYGDLQFDSLYIAVESFQQLSLLSSTLPYYDVDPKKIQYFGTSLWNILLSFFISCIHVGEVTFISVK